MTDYRKYISFFRIQFNMSLQYRAAAASGMVTQLVWGLMECMAFCAFEASDSSAYPMALSATISYVWLREAFFSAFTTWNADGEIFDSIMDGGIAYGLCRPVSIYNMWFSKTVARRLVGASLRCVPLLAVACVLPRPFRLALPASLHHFFLFVVTLFLGLGVTVAFCMFTYILAFFTISPQGLKTLFTSMVDFLAGAIIPLPFMPESVRHVVELLPFAGMYNVPLLIYSGELAGEALFRGIGMQCFWLVTLVVLGKMLCRAAERRIVVQGG